MYLSVKIFETNRTKTKVLSVLQILACIVVGPVFIVWAPWLSAIPKLEAINLYHEKVMPTWNAVVVEHGEIKEWKFGTVNQNPLGFTVCSIILFGIVGFLLWSAWHSHRLNKTVSKI